jgi:hypothetical protein
MRQLRYWYRVLLSTIFLTLYLKSTGQETGLKGKSFIYWGWNRGWFTNSDLHFEGDNYDFTLYNVQACDRPTPFSFRLYLNPENMTIPQNNFRAGYYFSDHYSISGGFDHMKYVMIQDQTVKISGEINENDSKFNGVYRDTTIVLTKGFLQYEHTNGLNYINFELNRFDQVIAIRGIRTNIFLTEGFGVGFLLPRTAVRFMNHELSDYFHVAGYGINLKAGLNIVICNVVTIQCEMKGGFINLPDVRISSSKVDRAHQHFFFLEPDLLFGATFALNAKNKK